MSWAARFGPGGSSSSSSRPSTSSNSTDSRPVKRTRPELASAAATSSSSRPGGTPARVEKIINTNAPPMLRIGRTTAQPVSDRQKALRTLFTQYQKLYAKILKENPALAHESALAQEADVSTSTPNLKAYKLAVHQAAVSISRRPVPDKIPHSSIGTLKESRAAQEAETIAKESKLTAENMLELCIPIDDMVEWGYPDLKDPEIQSEIPQPPGKCEEGIRRFCDRCKLEFVLSSDNPPIDCSFHHGRAVPERVDGRRLWIYSCCKNERGSAGCEEGVHVVSDKDDDKKLAQVNLYMTTENVVQGKPAKTVVDVVAVDCEMICELAVEELAVNESAVDDLASDDLAMDKLAIDGPTADPLDTTAGSSLARVSIVGEDGEPLLDEFVRQTFPVLDLNSRFSGITQDELDNAVMDLPQVRAAVCSFIGPNTVMVGHGLENDLRAMRLLHGRVIDTAVLFPHDRGRPFRRALRDLVKEKLGYFIQAGTAVAGHSSLEDARATLELLKWKVRDDKK